MIRIAGIATIPGREESLKDTIESLQNQVDGITIWNGKEQGDSAKFNSYSGNKDCHFFSCDDDLIYPPDYCDTLIKAYERTGNIISCHGRMFRPPIADYYHNGRVLQCLKEVTEERNVNCGGTGCMLITGHLSFDISDFTQKNMADIFIGIFAQQQNKSITVIPHKEGWIKHTTKIDMSKTIYSIYHRNCKPQTDLANSIIWNPL